MYVAVWKFCPRFLITQSTVPSNVNETPQLSFGDNFNEPPYCFDFSRDKNLTNIRHVK